MAPDLPSGTVTFLFTDVEGSTKLLHALGAAAYADALAEHRRMLREAFARHNGIEVDTQGDAFFVAGSAASHLRWRFVPPFVPSSRPGPVRPALAPTPSRATALSCATERSAADHHHLWRDRGAYEAFLASELWAEVVNDASMLDVKSADYGAMEELTRATQPGLKVL